MEATINIDNDICIEYSGEEPQVVSYIYMEASGEPIGNTKDFKVVLMEFIMAHTFDNAIADEDRELLLGMIKKMKCILKEAKNTLKSYEDR